MTIIDSAGGNTHQVSVHHDVVSDTLSVRSAVISPTGGANVPAIVGGVIGGFVGIALIAAFVFVVIRHRRRRQLAAAQTLSDGGDPMGGVLAEPLLQSSMD